jgi:hypothetical protein
LVDHRYLLPCSERFLPCFCLLSVQPMLRNGTNKSVLEAMQLVSFAFCGFLWFCL